MMLLYFGSFRWKFYKFCFYKILKDNTDAQRYTPVSPSVLSVTDKLYIFQKIKEKENKEGILYW